MAEKTSVELVMDFFEGLTQKEWNKLSVKEKNYFVKEVVKEEG